MIGAGGSAELEARHQREEAAMAVAYMAAIPQLRRDLAETDDITERSIILDAIEYAQHCAQHHKMQYDKNDRRIDSLLVSEQ